MKTNYEQMYIDLRKALVAKNLTAKSGGSSIDRMNPLTSVKDKLLQVIESCDRQMYTEDGKIKKPKICVFQYSACRS